MNTTPTIYEDAIARWGVEPQLNQATQELTELSLALLSSVTDVDNLAEETADCEIMLEELKVIYQNAKAVQDAKDKLPLQSYTTREAVNTITMMVFLLSKNMQHRYAESDGTPKGLKILEKITGTMARIELILDDLHARPHLGNHVDAWKVHKLERLAERIHLGYEIDRTRRSEHAAISSNA